MERLKVVDDPFHIDRVARPDDRCSQDDKIARPKAAGIPALIREQDRDTRETQYHTDRFFESDPIPRKKEMCENQHEKRQQIDNEGPSGRIRGTQSQVKQDRSNRHAEHSLKLPFKITGPLAKRRGWFLFRPCLGGMRTQSVLVCIPTRSAGTRRRRLGRNRIQARNDHISFAIQAQGHSEKVSRHRAGPHFPLQQSTGIMKKAFVQASGIRNIAMAQRPVWRVHARLLTNRNPAQFYPNILSMVTCPWQVSCFSIRLTEQIK